MRDPAQFLNTRHASWREWGLNTYSTLVCLALVAGPAGWTSAGSDLDWQAMPGGRWAALAVPQMGKTGFTLVPAQQTGVTFTNSLDEHAAAANRVLYNGSGVAVGDFDND